ncbi:MAG: hypothetical protein GY866_39560, partial [Proteobacteria bacterium]|nr:hypothetical protein [Pseudomonadota bacterium]
NKVDRLDKETVKKCLEETGEFLPHTQIVPTTHCRIDADSLLLTSPPKDWTAGETEHPEDTVYDFTTFSFSYNAFLDEKSFERFMRNLPKNIFRVKGIVRFPGRTRFLNYVGGQTHWTPWDGKPETRLVFIGWDADQTPVLENLKKCLATGLGA